MVLDETPRQLLGQVRQPIAAVVGRPAREDYEYRRLGSCNVFLATEPLAGTRMTKVTACRTRTDWAHFIRELAELYPKAKRITLVMDNLDTHRASALYHAFEAVQPRPCLSVLSLYTPPPPSTAVG